jgi:hypothetical protein
VTLASCAKKQEMTKGSCGGTSTTKGCGRKMRSALLLFDLSILRPDQIIVGYKFHHYMSTYPFSWLFFHCMPGTEEDNVEGSN